MFREERAAFSIFIKRKQFFFFYRKKENVRIGERLMKVKLIRERVLMKSFIVGWNKDSDDEI